MPKRRPIPPRVIPDDNSVARFCSAATVLDSTGHVTGAAFFPRPQDEGRISVEWVECVSAPPLTVQLDAIRASLSKRVVGYRASGKIALLRTGDVRNVVHENQRLDVVHRPTHSSRCHAGIIGLDGLLVLPLAEMLSDLANTNTVSA